MKRIIVGRDATPMQIAAEACNLYTDNLEARDAMLQCIKENPADFKEMYDELISYACYYCVSEMRHKRTRQIKSKIEVHPKGEEVPSKMTSGARGVAAKASGGLLMFLKVGNKLMKDCTKMDLLDSAGKRRLESRGSLSRAIFEEKIASGLSDQQKVIDKYDEAALVKLQKSAEKRSGKQIRLQSN